MNTKTIASIILGLAILITLSTSVYITNEAQQVIITQFGRPVGEVVGCRTCIPRPAVRTDER